MSYECDETYRKALTKGGKNGSAAASRNPKAVFFTIHVVRAFCHTGEGILFEQIV